ncbi:hypothetical protein [Thauera humireducens]|uniref:Uncharacterized protein n=1 Tax=Thauera humireducens TaxID=1134435 RepID=A0A127K8W3_9RHOO|nr:hypothetical protein [Thauera humireducens]AMO38331.1 hypothetical protein AC731_016155 [Thauera humireducens]
MLELLTGFVALAAFLAISYFRGRSKKESALATALSSPSEVARLYLRHSPEMNAHWLHVQFRNGRKRVIAAPWELDDILARLEAKGLRLDEADRNLLATVESPEASARRPGETRRHTAAPGTPLRAGA